MQSGLTSADRKLLWILGASMLVLLVATGVLAPAEGSEGSGVPSSYSPGSRGALAAYLLLGDLGFKVRRWQEPPTALAGVGEDAILVLAEPGETPSVKEIQALHHFIEKGGRVLFCGPEIRSFFPEAPATVPAFLFSGRTYTREFPSYITRSAPEIVLQPMVHWGALDARQIRLYGDADSPVVVSWAIGDGQVIWWADATPLTNSGISRASNLGLFVSTVQGSGARIGPAVYWDEYFHGERGSLWSYVDKTPVRWGLVQISFIVVCILFAFSRRAGPISTGPVVSRLSPVEFVDTMGGLYQRAGAASIPIEVSRERLRLEFRRRLGLAVNVRDADLAAAASRRLGLGPGLGETLEAAENAIHVRKIRPRLALRLVRDLDTYTARSAAGKRT